MRLSAIAVYIPQLYALFADVFSILFSAEMNAKHIIIDKNTVSFLKVKIKNICFSFQKHMFFD